MSDTNTTVNETNAPMSDTEFKAIATQAIATAAAPAATVTMVDVHKAELAMAEKLVRLKYPHLKIVEGSMIQEPAHPVYGNKRRVQVACPVCGALVERATSDLHTFKACANCMKGVRKANKDAKKVQILEALAAAKAGNDSDE